MLVPQYVLAMQLEKNYCLNKVSMIYYSGTNALYDANYVSIVNLIVKSLPSDQTLR